MKNMENMVKEFNCAKEITDEMIVRNAHRCMDLNVGMEAISNLREKAKHCKSIKEYTAFFDSLGITAEESENSIIIHLNKTQCTCPMVSLLTIDKQRLCDCTKEREKYMWSEVFDREIDIQIVESFLRGGNDCVLKLIFN